MTGSAFLVAYAIAFVATLAAALYVRHRLRAPADAPADGALHPYEQAQLRGGGLRVLLAAIASLEARGIVRINQVARMISSTQAVPGDASPLDAALVNAVGVSPLSIDRALVQRLLALPELSLVRAELERRGLLLDEEATFSARFWPALMMGTLAFLGVGRIVAGMASGHSVGILSAAIVVATLATAWFASQRSIPTLRGVALLAKHENSSTARLSTPDRPHDDVARDIARHGTQGGTALAAALALFVTTPNGSRDGGCGGGGCGDGGGCGGCGGCGD